MQAVKSSSFATPVRIRRNTSASSKNHQWAQIIDAKTGKVLHTGRIHYISVVARKRYNVKADL